MVKLTEEVKESLKGVKNIFLATCSRAGVPNVVPMGAFKLLDDETMLLSDQYMQKSLSNMKENPRVAIAYWGEKGGFQIKGTVTLHTDDQIFKEDVAWVKGIKPTLNPKTAIVMKITDVYMVKPGPDAGKKIL
ncbi:putative flavin-nucleotide-binding protein structurally [Methanocella conradii HZ254]|uniref:Flavin-nucleotide-binding protein structurally n=1 Tax=Methanocella conradii (strain DSM 24694 / JCM 17849 / CGMCC 1.5162 / HZ254) TaxID=1041930 RepID=H8I9E2_METCZ|nr:pyridoxamine 5'-phosphate oxidase family protein [Methanocella conradii]AFC99560.1 putative flavin-nucleotide-binding protein structurally [Methanocella conradii HZ254]MDI6897406.1 pyridoxamine 5'-phosphate oxidase family protein [Methanocella conradii]